MKFEVGDKVKFINEEGGGVVSKIITPILVNVMIEDGFEIPTSTSNLIKIDLENAAGRFFFKEEIPTLDKGGDQEGADSVTVEKISPLLNKNGNKRLPEGVYFSFVPHDQKWLITGLLDIYILNNTGFDLSYAYYLNETDATYTGMDADNIPAYSKMYLQTIDREEINDWNQGVIQVIFFKESLKKIPLPVSCHFWIRESKFLREDNYVSTSLMEGRSIISVIAELSKQGSVTSHEMEGKVTIKEKKKPESREVTFPSFIDKHRIAQGEAEVDLHIEELVDDVKSLDPEHILKIQLDYFSKCLEDALEHHYHRMIFIHGVGNGTLKTEIRMILDKYDYLQYHIAPMAKYGVGAIEVTRKPDQ
jgi:hypothetical protein